MVAKRLHTAASDPTAALGGSQTIAFDRFRIDLRRAELFRGDQPVRLRPKTWSVLVYLVERPGTLISRDELLDALWPDVAVTPDTLSKSIGELRVALGDDATPPRFIETVHSRGYRFLATARRAAEANLVFDAAGAQRGAEVPRGAAAVRPFVGREAELQLLATRLAKAHAGERQIVFVTGPAGVGKTALVDAFLDSRAVCESATPLWVGRASCFEHYASQEPYFPVFEALERLARPPKVERLVRLMRRAAPMWLAQMPWLVGEADAEALRQSLQGVRPERMPRELAALIDGLTADVTLMLVLEDLHWSDPSTVDVLTLLAQHHAPQRLLVVGTYRQSELAMHEPLAGAARALAVHQRCIEVALHDLDEEAVRSYLIARFPGNAFPPELAHVIYAHTGGQPLFVVAIVDHMVSRGWILETAPGWALSSTLESIHLGVPDDVREMIEMQLRRLSPAQRALLEAASVAGNQITAQILATVLDCEVAVAEQHCETVARTAHFLEPAGTIEWPNGEVARRYRFTHELHRQVVYDDIPDERRAELHQSIGLALETIQGSQASELAAQLAAHFQCGRDAVRACRYLTAVGIRARQRFASREAIAYFEAALALLPRLGGDVRGRLELDVSLALGRAFADVYGFGADAVRDNYERVAALCATSGSASELFEAVYARWYLQALRAKRDETLALAAQLKDLARRLGSAEHGAIADSALLRTAFYEGRFTEVRHHMDSLLAQCPPESEQPLSMGYGIDPLIAATIHYAGALWHCGDPLGARHTAHAGLARARQSRNPFFLSAALGQVALLELLCRNSPEGGTLAEQAAALAAEHGFVFWHRFASTLTAYARIQDGHVAEGARALADGLTVLRSTGNRVLFTYLYAFLADAFLRNRAYGEGLDAVDAGLAVAETTLDRGYAGELWRLKGELLLATTPTVLRRIRGERAEVCAPAASGHDWPAAEECLLRALEVSRAAHSTSLELRAAISLSRVWRRRGRRREGHALLAEICGRFDAKLATPDLLEARTQLAGLAAAR